MNVLSTVEGRDIVFVDSDLESNEVNIMERGLDKMQAPNTVNPKNLEKLISAYKRTSQ